MVIIFCFPFCLAAQSQNWDVNLLNNLNPQNPDSRYWINITNSVYPVSAAMPVGLVVAGFIKKDKQLQYKGWEAFGAIVINSVVTQGMKFTINRERPYEKYSFIHAYDISDHGKSFPSGHTSTAFATATTLTLEFKKWYVILPAYAWATSVAYSRLYLGEHYPTDVIAGAVVGTGSTFLSDWLTKKFFEKEKKKPVTTP